MGTNEPPMKTMDIIQAILAALSVLLTAVYAFLTYKILHANKKQITSSIRPYVYFDLRLSGGSVEAFLKNSGKTGAYDVKIDIEPPLQVAIRGGPRPACLTASKIPLLFPEQEICEYLESYHELTQRVAEPVFTGKIEYRDAEGNSHKESFRCDLTVLKDLAHIAQPDVAEELKRVADRLSEIQRSIDNIGKFNR